mmetsp:Transcript_6112/g.10178  ORF Transcript_6112/g.10178 Transcript_6112/m.10178 type:complete len:202 (+) Transcript_6112:2485-3090(+)
MRMETEHRRRMQAQLVLGMYQLRMPPVQRPRNLQSLQPMALVRLRVPPLQRPRNLQLLQPTALGRLRSPPLQRPRLEGKAVTRLAREGAKQSNPVPNLAVVLLLPVPKLSVPHLTMVLSRKLVRLQPLIAAQEPVLRRKSTQKLRKLSKSLQMLVMRMQPVVAAQEPATTSRPVLCRHREALSLPQLRRHPVVRREPVVSR